MTTPMPTFDQVQQIPSTRGGTVTEDFIDHNGHMNILFYLELNSYASDDLCQVAGIDDDYRADRGMGVFTTEHHILYTAEMRLGDEFTVHPQVVGRSSRALHMVSYVVNQSARKVANSLELILVHVDLAERRAAHLPDDIAAGFAKIEADQPDVEWAPPLSGVMGAR